MIPGVSRRCAMAHPKVLSSVLRMERGGQRQNFIVAKSGGACTLLDSMRPMLAFALVALTLSCFDVGVADARKTKLLKNSLLSVVDPHPGEPANAHPFVNVIVLFGRLSDGTPADPASFKAKMGREDITSSFVPTYANGQQNGVRTKLDASRVKLGRRPRNVLRLSVLSQPTGKKGARAKDVDRLRFGALEGENKLCVAQGDADTEVIVPGIPVKFTGSKGSSDPDRDELTYTWTFGDGTTSTEPDPEHAYDVQVGDVMAALTVSDGQASCTDQFTLQAVPALDPGKTPGTLFVASTAPLEFGAKATGTNTAKTLTLTNTDETATSQVKIRLATTSPAFQVSEPNVALGPGESHDITLSFVPQAGGHQHARVAFVANASNRQALSLLAHGYGGTAPDNGPTFAADPVFFTEVDSRLLGLATFGIMPDGRRFFADNGVHTCDVPGNGLGTGDFCLTDANCAANGGTCPGSSVCLAGANAGQPCSVPADCPGSYCRSYSLFDPVDFCSDGKSLFLISDEGTFTEPDPAAETERAVTLLRMDLDDQGNVVNRELLGRTTTETGHIACDGFSMGQGGQVYIPEFHNVPDQGLCFRSERESLVRIAKNNGSTQVITSRIDAYEGLAECDDLDPVMQLEMTRDGGRMLAGFESGGLWQIRPAPLFYSADISELFQIHPDGSVIYAGTTDSGATGLVNLYRITPGQVQHGPLPYSALLPCSSFAVPNNTLRDAAGRTVIIGVGATRAAVGSSDATALVTFVAASPQSLSIPSLLQMITPTLIVRGTVAFSAPADTTTCSVEGLVNLEALELAF